MHGAVMSEKDTQRRDFGSLIRYRMAAFFATTISFCGIIFSAEQTALKNHSATKNLERKTNGDTTNA